MDAVAAIVTELEWHREDRPAGAVVPLDLDTLRGDIERVPQGQARRKLESQFDDMEAAIRTARRPRPAPGRRRVHGR